MVVWWYLVTKVTVFCTTIYILIDFHQLVGKIIIFVTTTNNHGKGGGPAWGWDNTEDFGRSALVLPGRHMRPIAHKVV